MSLTYGSYLKVPELLRLQVPASDPPEHDEMLFIIIHQVYELWFRLLLHEVDRAKAELSAGDLFGAIARFKRLRTVMKTLVGQLDILETMTPLEFLSFRDRLESGSGFQSYQFRELEFRLGRKHPSALERYPEGSAARRRLAERLEAPTLWDSVLHYMAACGVPIPRDQLERDVTRPIESSPGVREALVQLYRHNSEMASLCERLVDLDEGIMEWRYRHVKMVQRTIGTRRGTGGSAGAEYLMTTLNQPLFPDLWAIRSEL